MEELIELTDRGKSCENEFLLGNGQEKTQRKRSPEEANLHRSRRKEEQQNKKVGEVWFRVVDGKSLLLVLHDTY